VKRRSLVARLIIWQAAAMGVAWVGLTAWLVSTMSAMGNGDLDRRMYTLAQTLAEAASAAGPDAERMRQRLAAAEHIFIDGVIRGLDSGEDYVATYQVWSREGTLLHRSVGAPKQAMARNDGEFAQRDVEGRSYRTVAAQSSDGSVRVDIGEDEQLRWASLWPMLRIIGLAQLLILFWVLAVTWLAARGGFRPLVALATQLGRRQPGDLTPLADEKRYRELTPIVDELNSLLARESSRLETERGFLADAAHELRTPLAAVAAQAHLVAHTADAARREAAAVELQQGIDRASHLLSQLLTMARLEAGHSGGAPEVLDVAEFGRQRVALVSALARSRGVAIALDAPESLIARIQRTALGSILDNLVDNATRYTPAGGQVLVRLSAVPEGFTLEVLDDGPGIAPELRTKVFERFYRVPGSDQPGSGLGLAIVKRFVDTQQASLAIRPGLGGHGIGFEIRFSGQA
jgi:signal transduction histidine kinase